MNANLEVPRHNASLIPIPYGCMTRFILILGSLGTLLISSVAIGISILK
jgi:hypothetical protein